MRRHILILLTVIAAALGSACTGNPALPSATISTLSISGAAPGVGTSAQFSATEVPANSASTEDVTALATWSVADTTVATVSKTGVVTGVKAGSTTLTATYGGSTVSMQISIHV
jgi:hypothetical protein